LQELVTDTTFTIGGITINGALIGGIIVPGILVVAAIFWPYLDKSSVRAVGVWMATERRKQNIVFLIVVALILILTIIGTFLRGPYWNWYWPWQSWPTMPRKF
jgi:cytochrome b-561